MEMKEKLRVAGKRTDVNSGVGEGVVKELR